MLLNLSFLLCKMEITWEGKYFSAHKCHLYMTVIFNELFSWPLEALSFFMVLIYDIRKLYTKLSYFIVKENSIFLRAPNPVTSDYNHIESFYHNYWPLSSAISSIYMLQFVENGQVKENQILCEKVVDPSNLFLEF